MSTSYAQGPDVIDSVSAKGDTILAHSPEVAQSYRDAAAEAAKRGPSRVIKSSQPAAPAETPLPYVGVARAFAGKEIQRLRAQAEGGKRDLAGRFVFTASGFQVSDPVQLAMRGQLVAEVEAAEGEAARLSALDDAAVCRWAASRGVR